MVTSLTVTVCSQLTWLPQSSSAVQVTTVTPVQKVSGASLVTVTLLQSSLAPGSPMSAITQQPVISTSGGHSSDGGVVSWTVMIWSQVSVPPQVSLAVHVRVMT